MEHRNALALAVVVAGGLVGWATSEAGVPIQKVRELRRQQRGEKGRTIVLYKFEQQYLTAAQQAARRGDQAAKAWKDFDKEIDPIAVVARSPFGGGETAGSYWPADVKPELLRQVGAALRKRELEVALPGLPEQEPQKQGEPKQDEKAGEAPPKPWPAVGFSEDYEFVLVVGLHYEPVPYRSARRTADGKVHTIRSSRVNAWAILFRVPTGSAFWATAAVARVGHGTAADPLNLAAEAALSRLDFADLGTHNIPGHIEKFKQRKELPAMDAAALLVQTQRADAVEAVVTASMSKWAFTDTAWVLRYFNQRGTPQDYRISPEQVRRQRCVRVSQRLMVRVLLLEQLRGMRGLQACVFTALRPHDEDIEVQPIGVTYAGRLGPLSGDDEIVLIAELANRRAWDRSGAFWRNGVAAVKNLGKCRTYLDEAMAVAKTYADLPVPRPRRGRKPRPNPYKEAGKAVLAELAKTRVEQQKKKAMGPAGL